MTLIMTFSRYVKQHVCHKAFANVLLYVQMLGIIGGCT